MYIQRQILCYVCIYINIFYNHKSTSFSSSHHLTSPTIPVMLTHRDLSVLYIAQHKNSNITMYRAIHG